MTLRSPRYGLAAVAAAVLAVLGVVVWVVDGPDLHPATAEGNARANTVQGSPFGIPQYYGNVAADTMFNTTTSDGTILTTANDTEGTDHACGAGGKDIAILKATGTSPSSLSVSTVNCMPSFGPKGGGKNTHDLCSWKSGGLTAVGDTLYLAVARQLHGCSRGHETLGLQPSYNASIMKSTDGGLTWTNPWGTTSTDGAAPPWSPSLGRYRAMFPGNRFSVPFFIQYGPGNTDAVDGGNKYLYAVSTDGFAYNGNSLVLARVPLNRVQSIGAWQYYHGPVGGSGRTWTSSVRGATRVLQAKNGVSQPAIQYVPALKEYVLSTFSFTHARSDFPTRFETPYSSFRLYTAPKPWGPWTLRFRHSTQRNLWCAASPCPLVSQPGSSLMQVGAPADRLGLYDPAIVQKFVYTRPVTKQAVFTGGDWKNKTEYGAENLYRLHVIPVNLARLAAGGPAR